MASVLYTHEHLHSENERKYEDNNMLHKDITAPIYGNIEIWKSALKIVQVIINSLFHFLL